MPDALDPLPLLRYLSERGVEHIVIGGFAVSAHGHVRASKDLDIVPNPAPENLERLAIALRDTHAVDAEVSDFDPDLEGITVRVCGLEHLLSMKRAAGRPQDLEDLKRLAAT